MIKIRTLYFQCFILKIFTCLLAISTENTIFAQKNNEESTKALNKELLSVNQVQKIEELLLLFPDNTQFSIGIYDQGEIQRFGLIHRLREVEMVPNHSFAFEIGSVSKVFTALMLSEAVINKKVKLSAPVQKYLPFPLELDRKANKKFTLQSLANHTSGLPRVPANLFVVAGMKAAIDPYANYTQKYLWKALQMENFLEQKPDTKYSYSNFGAGLLGQLLANIYKTDYESNLQNMVVEPYRLKNTTTDLEEVKDNFVHGLKPNGDSATHWSFQSLAGAGAVLSTVDDLLIVAEKALKPGSREKLMQKVSTKLRPIGLAWHIDKGNYWHNGGTAGFTSMLIFDPKAQRAIVILTNVSAFHPKSEEITSLGFELMKN